MRDLQIMLLIVVAFVSMIPVVEMSLHRHVERYKNLRIFIVLVFAWSLLMLFKYFMPVSAFVYQVHFASYTVVLLASFYFLRTVYEFYNMTPPRWLQPAMLIYLPVHLLVMLTNSQSKLVLDVSLSEFSSLSDLFYADINIGMIVHMIVAYTLLFWAIVMLLYKYRYIPFKKKHKDAVGFFIVSLVVILPINLWHIFTSTLYVDPTYLSVVFFSFITYYIAFKRNFMMALSAEGRKNLLSNMREYYVLATDDGRIVEISPGLLKRFPIQRHEYLDPFLISLSRHAYLYEDIDAVKDKSKDRPYLYTEMKTFRLDKFNVQGMLHLFYDETKFVKLVHELEEIQDTDIMTGLLNRNYLEKNIRTLAENHPSYGLLLCDLDGLKLFNDHFGHNRGDQLILKFVKKLREFQKRHPDIMLIRSGGDEFLIIVHDASNKVLQTMQHDIVSLGVRDDPFTSISVSVGYALRKENDDFDDVYRRADKSLYHMKRRSSPQYRQAFMRRIKEMKKET